MDTVWDLNKYSLDYSSVFFLTFSLVNDSYETFRNLDMR